MLLPVQGCPGAAEIAAVWAVAGGITSHWAAVAALAVDTPPGWLGTPFPEVTHPGQGSPTALHGQWGWA